MTLGDVLPNVTLGHGVDRAVISGHVFRDAVARHPSVMLAANLSDLVRCEERVSPVTIPPKDGVVMFKILSQRTPFQVFRAVVQLVSVLVVNGALSLFARVERHSHKAVDLFLNARHGIFRLTPTSGRSRPNGSSEIPVNIQAPASDAARPSDTTKRAGIVSRVFGDLPPFFVFHRWGFIDEARLTQGAF